jgi:hypothetical protein
MSEELLTCESFSGHVGEKFRIVAEEVDGWELELIEATPIKTQETRHKRPPFSLVFRGPMEPVLNQQIVPLEHDSMGKLDIFLVPIGPDEDGMQYEAVFS